MGYGSVKYADLKSHRLTNYKFSYDDMLSLQVNTCVKVSACTICACVEVAARALRCAASTQCKFSCTDILLLQGALMRVGLLTDACGLARLVFQK